MRLLAVLVVALVVAIEIGFYINTMPETTVSVTTFEETADNDSIFAGVNQEEKENPELAVHKEKYFLIIGATIIIGVLLTFAIPQKHRQSSV